MSGPFEVLDWDWPAGSFAARLAATMRPNGQLCVGIDPHDSILEAWGLPSSSAGVRELGLRVVEAAAGRVSVVKPQIAFFERFGSQGYAALEEVLAAARAAGLFVIADVKRGDIGSTVEAYGAAWLSAGSPLEADAMTAVAYQGVGSLNEVLSLASSGGKGVFLLAATSNPEGKSIQSARTASGFSVAHEVAMGAETEWGTAGLVIGATVDRREYGITSLDQIDGLPLLVPGFGVQGARLSDIPDLFGPLSPLVVANVSREILSAGPDGIVAAIDRSVAEIAG